MHADVSNLYSCAAAANPAAMSHVCVTSASQHITKCPCCYDLAMACLQNSAVKLPTDMVNTCTGFLGMSWCAVHCVGKVSELVTMIHMSVVSSANYNNHMVVWIHALPQCGCGLMGEHFTGSIHSKFNNLKLNPYT